MTPASHDPTFHVWTVSETKAGTLTQCLGVARFIDRYLAAARLSPRAAQAFKARLPEAFRD